MEAKKAIQVRFMLWRARLHLEDKQMPSEDGKLEDVVALLSGRC